MPQPSGRHLRRQVGCSLIQLLLPGVRVRHVVFDVGNDEELPRAVVSGVVVEGADHDLVESLGDHRDLDVVVTH